MAESSASVLEGPMPWSKKDTRNPLWTADTCYSGKARRLLRIDYRNKSGTSSRLPGTTEYLLRSVMPAVFNTSSSMKKLPVVVLAIGNEHLIGGVGHDLWLATMLGLDPGDHLQRRGMNHCARP